MDKNGTSEKFEEGVTMAKGIIVAEMPESCARCPFETRVKNESLCIIHENIVLTLKANPISDIQNRPDWCPMRPMPARKTGRGLPKYDTDIHYEIGWNDCMDYLEGRNGE